MCDSYLLQGVSNRHRRRLWSFLLPLPSASPHTVANARHTYPLEYWSHPHHLNLHSNHISKFQHVDSPHTHFTYDISGYPLQASPSISSVPLFASRRKCSQIVAMTPNWLSESVRFVRFEKGAQNVGSIADGPNSRCASRLSPLCIENQHIFIIRTS